MTRWWAGLPAAQATISCGAQQHRLRWQAGELRALDHSDADAERTLAALGGQRCDCVDMLDAWHRHADDLRVLVLASRGGTDQVRPRPDPPSGGGPTPVRARRGRASRSVSAVSTARILAGGWAHPAPVTADPEDALIELLQLGGGLPDRLAATVAASWSLRTGQQDEAARRALPQLHAALYGRAAAAVRGWLGHPALAVDLHMIDGRQQPGLTRRDRAILAELPLRWLVDVWAKGLAVTAGRFCLAARASGGRWTLSAVAPDLLEPRPLTVELPADE